MEIRWIRIDHLRVVEWQVQLIRLPMPVQVQRARQQCRHRRPHHPQLQHRQQQQQQRLHQHRHRTIRQQFVKLINEHFQNRIRRLGLNDIYVHFHICGSSTTYRRISTIQIQLVYNRNRFPP